MSIKRAKKSIEPKKALSDFINEAENTGIKQEIKPEITPEIKPEEKAESLSDSVPEDENKPEKIKKTYLFKKSNIQKLELLKLRLNHDGEKKFVQDLIDEAIEEYLKNPRNKKKKKP